MEQLPFVQWGRPTKQQEAAFTRLYGQLCVDRLFNAPESFWNIKGELLPVAGPDLDSEPVEHPSLARYSRRVMQVLRMNEKTWRKALRSQNLPRPLSPATLLAESPEKPFLQVTFLSDLQPTLPIAEQEIADKAASLDELLEGWLAGYNWN
jgi:hypothetical protein